MIVFAILDIIKNIGGKYLVFSKLIFVFLISFFVSLISILFLRPLAKKIGLVDSPSGRKLHEGNIPMIGGASIFFGLAFSIIGGYSENFIIISIIASGFFIVIIGFVDDFYPLPVTFRILFQIAVVSLMVYFTELKFDTFGHSFGLSDQIFLGFLSYPVTILGIVFLINAFNLMDGADGVTGSLALLASFGILIVETIFGDWILNPLPIAIAGSLIPFLYYNIKKSDKIKIFLGDSGSLFLGFIIASTLLYNTQTNNTFSPTIALWIVAIPVFDVIAVIIHRIKILHSLFLPDRSHLHYFLQKIGLSNVQVLIFINGLGIIILFIGILIEYSNRFYSFPIFLLILFGYIWLRVFSKISKFNF